MKEAFKSFMTASYRSAFAVLGITLSILMLVAVGNLAFFSHKTYSQIRENVRVEVFPKTDVKHLTDFLGLLGGVERVEVVDEKKAKEEFLMHYPQLKDVLERLGDDVFTTVVRVHPKEHWRDVEYLSLLSREIEAYKGVSGVYFGRDWLETAQTFFGVLLGLNVAVLLISFTINLLVSFYTVRFVVHNRKNLIEIMRLAGVSPLRLRYPYILLSVIYAVLAWIITVPPVFAALRFFAWQPDVLKFNLYFTAFVLVITAATTIMGASRALEDVEEGLK